MLRSGSVRGNGQGQQPLVRARCVKGQHRVTRVVADFAPVQEAWDEHVPAEQGTGADLFASVEEGLQRLEVLLADAVAKAEQPAHEAPPAVAVQPTTAAAPSEPAVAPSSAEQKPEPEYDASAVNVALGAG